MFDMVRHEQTTSRPARRSHTPSVWADLRRKMGPSRAIRDLVAEVRRVASTDLTVLLTGETGTGKDLLANALHQGSPRSTGPFIAVDCGAITASLAESLLFGHEAGAFTGAVARRIGDFERAQGGTLFLDEVANLPAEVQCKLLRAVESREIRRVGGAESIAVNIRLVVACSTSLSAATEEGGFRRDLFHRLNEYPIVVPALRARREDIPYLARRFVRELCSQREQVTQRIAPQSDKMLMGQDWPGNVRELRNVMRRASVRAEDRICPVHLGLKEGNWEPLGTQEATEDYGNAGTLQMRLDLAERQIVSKTLTVTNGNKAEAARRLGIDYRTLHRKLRRHGISTTQPSHRPA